MSRREANESPVDGSDDIQDSSAITGALELTFDAVVASDAQELITFWNRAAERIYGWTAQEALGKAPAELFWPASTPEEKKDLKQRLLQLKRGETVQGEHKACRKDDSLIWVQYVTRAKFDANRKVTGYLSVYRDISVEVLARERMRESEERYAKAFRASPDAISISRLSDGQILEINNSWKTLFGYDESEALGRSSLELNLLPDAEDRAVIVRKIQQQGYLKDLELDVRQKSGERRRVSLSVEKLKFSDIPCLLSIVRDITEPRRVKEELALSSRRLNDILESIQDDLYVLDRNWAFVYASPKFASRFGKKPEEFVGHSFWAMFPKHVGTTSEENLRAAMEGREVRRFEMPGKYTEAWYRMTVFPSAEGITVLGTDISERKRLEYQIWESRQRLSLIYEHTAIGMMETSPQGTFIGCNDVFCQGLGYTKEEIIGRSIDDVTYEDDVWIDLNLHRKLLAGEIPFYRIEKRYVRKDGSLLWAEVVRTMVHDEHGIALFGVGAMLDINERKRAEWALRDSEERYRHLVKHAPAAIYEVDLETTQFTEVNDCMCEMLGYTREELMSMMPGDLLDEESRGRFSERVRSAMIGEHIPEHIEYRVKTKDNRHLWVVLNTTFNYDDGKPKSVSVIAHDISERRKREEMLRDRTEEIETLMNVSPIAVFVAHDPECTHITGNPAAYKLLQMPENSDANLSKSAPVHERPTYRIYRDGVELMPEELPMQMAARLGVEIKEDVLELRFESGARKFIYSFAKPLLDSHGKSRGAIATMLDISERKKMEEALLVARQKAEIAASRMARLQEVTAELAQTRTSQEVGRIIVEEGAPAFGASNCSILLLSDDGQSLEFLYSNTAENIRRKWSVLPISMNTPATDTARSGELIWIESQEQYLKRYPHLSDAIKEWGYEAALSIPMAYKERLLGVLTMSFRQPLPYSPEDEDYILTLARQGAQTLERVRADEARRLDATMMRNVAAGIYLVRASDGIIIHTNPNFDMLFGYQPGEVIGKHVSILNAPTDRSPNAVSEQIMETLKEQGSWRGEVYSAKKDGTRFWCSASISTFEHATHGTVWVAARQDITERKRAEEALHENERQLQRLNETLEQKVQEKTAEVRRLASDLTKAEQRERNRISLILHEDLQQRLFAIQMQMAVLRERLQVGDALAGTDVADIKEQLDEILLVTRRLSVDLSPPILHDEGLLHAISWLASQMEEQHDLRIHVQGEGSFAFPDKDLQVLLFNSVRELLLNILQHAGAKQAFVSLQRVGSDLRIEVRDDGNGFPMDPTEQFGSITWSKNKRPSFGLATIHHQLSLLGGRIDINSEPGLGTRVILTVPVP